MAEAVLHTTNNPGQTPSGPVERQMRPLAVAILFSLIFHVSAAWFIVSLRISRSGEIVHQPQRPLELSLVASEQLNPNTPVPRPRQTHKLLSSPKPPQVSEPNEQPAPSSSPPLQEEKPASPSIDAPAESTPIGSIEATSKVDDLPIVGPIFDADYLRNPAPPYPLIARHLKLQGTVVVRVLVSQEGEPDVVRLEKSSGSSVLDQTALNAVKRWSFIPARQGDTPIPAWVDVPILFRLK